MFPSYIGLAQGLMEGGFFFDVLFAGDGHFVQDRLTSDDLKPYRMILLPSPIALTPNQQMVVKQFVEEGGTLVCQETERVGITGGKDSAFPAACTDRAFRSGKGQVIVLKGDISAEWTSDVGSEFFRNYRSEDRAKIIELGKALGIDRVLRSEDGLVCAFPVSQPSMQRVIVHLVNYDLNLGEDAIREKENIAIHLRRSLLPEGFLTCTLWVPGAKKPKILPVITSGDALSCVVPRLGTTATVIISVTND